MNIEINGASYQRYQRFIQALRYSESLNREMNLRFFFLQRSADLAQNEAISAAVSAIGATVRSTNSGFARLVLCRSSLENRTVFIRPDNAKDDFDIVSTGSDEYPAGFGAIPFLIGVGVAVVVLVTGALATVKVCDTIQQKAIADIKIESLKSEQLFAASSPTVQNRWTQFKQLQAPLLKEIDRLQGQNQGMFGGLGDSIKTMVMIALAAFVLFKVLDKA
jgi:hypothetical protein